MYVVPSSLPSSSLFLLLSTCLDLLPSLIPSSFAYWTDTRTRSRSVSQEFRNVRVIKPQINQSGCRPRVPPRGPRGAALTSARS